MKNKAVKLVEVKSSNISAVGYNEDSNELVVKFKSKSSYVYSNVPKEKHEEMLKAKSIGSYFIRNIRDFHECKPFKELEVKSE